MADTSFNIERAEPLNIVYYDFNIVKNKLWVINYQRLLLSTGNLPKKMNLRLNDTDLCNLSPPSFGSKYGYEKILIYLLDDLQKLEWRNQGLFWKVENKFCFFIHSYYRQLAAHALGRFF